MKPISILMVAVPRMLLDIIEAAVAREPDLRLAEVLDDRDALVDGVERLRPDVVLIGLGPDEQVADYAAALRAHPPLKLLGITADGRDASLLELRLHHVVLDSPGPSDLVRTIRDAVRRDGVA